MKSGAESCPRHAAVSLLREGAKVNRLSVLAFRAIEGGTAALDEAPDRPAAWARLALAIVDRKPFREVAELAVGRSEVAQGRAAGLDCFGENRVDRGHEPAQALERDGAAGAGRMNAGAEQRLAYVNIAEARDDPLIEEEELDRRASPREAAPELPGVDIGRLGPKGHERRPLAKLVGLHQVE